MLIVVPCEAEEDAKRVFGEIEWGHSYRFKKIESQKFDSSHPFTPHQQIIKKKKQKKKRVVCICHTKPSQNKPCREVVDRRLLTRIEHTNLLAEPKSINPCVHPVCKPLKTRLESGKSKVIPPRHLVLSLPNSHRLLSNWQSFFPFLIQEKLQNLSELLKKTDALTTKEASTYFGHLTKQRQKCVQKLKNEKEKQVCQQKIKSKNDISRFIKSIMTFFCKRPLAKVKDRHVIITTEILNRILTKNLAKKFRRASDNCCTQMLYDFVDQISVWIDLKIDEVDMATLLDEEEREVSMSSSGTDTSCTESYLLHSDKCVRQAALERQRQRELEELGEKLPSEMFVEEEWVSEEELEEIIEAELWEKFEEEKVEVEEEEYLLGRGEGK